MPQPLCQNLFLSPTDPIEVMNVINSLNASKASGPNSIPSHLFKLCSPILCKPISFIINESFNQGIFPDILKLAKVTPVYKSGPTEVCSNYGPLSLLSNISNVIEKTVCTRLNDFLEKYELLYDLQFGFRKNYSTNHALINLVTNINDILEGGEYACGIFIDLQKAFDTVNHDILLNKLEIYGVRGIPLNWFESYLKGRKQFVALESANSDIQVMDFGVPQGSILGPLLFLIYINDFRRSVKSGLVQHFADDTVILFRNTSMKKLNRILTREISTFYDWLCANRLSLNSTKSDVLLFRAKNKRCEVKFNLKVKNKRIPLSKKTTYLGIVLDSRLAWIDQISELSKKLARANGLLAKIRYYVDTPTIKSLYYSLFHSHMTYGCLTWGLASKSNISRIIKLQQHALRIITFSIL